MALPCISHLVTSCVTWSYVSEVLSDVCRILPATGICACSVAPKQPDQLPDGLWCAAVASLSSYVGAAYAAGAAFG